MTEYLIIPIIAFLAELIDSTLGGGYGTILSPVLILMGYDPKIVVPSVLMSELFTGLSAGVTHWRIGNLKMENPNIKKTCIYMMIFSVVGAAISAGISLKISSSAISWIIVMIVIAMGLSGVAGLVDKMKFSLSRILGIGALASFNKAISGGGYGPIVTMGQLISGVDAKSSVAITSLAEGVVCFVASIIYMLKGKPIDYRLTMIITFSAMCSIPFCGIIVKKIPEKIAKRLVSVCMLALGILLAIKLI